jgi:predicted permease
VGRWRKRTDADFADEIRAAIAIETDRLIAGGMNADEARAAAHRAFGNVSRAQEHFYESRRVIWLDDLARDVRYVVRVLLKDRGFAAAAIFTLALGIGGNTTIFSILNSILYKPLPVVDPNGLVALRTSAASDDVQVSYNVWTHLRDRGVLGDAFAWTMNGPPVSVNGERVPRAEAMWVTGRFFDALGVHAVQGRTLTPDDDRRSGGRNGPAAVISYAFWQRQFSGDPAIIGRSITADRVPFTIVGVAPRGFYGVSVGRSFDVALPLDTMALLAPEPSPLDSSFGGWFNVMARLAPGRSAQQTTAALQLAQRAIRTETMPDYPRAEDREQYLREPWVAAPDATGSSNLRERYLPALRAVFALVAVVLIVACVNLANLQLARAAARRHEFSVRVAIGASRARLVRQLLTESLVLSLVGAAFGLIVARSAADLLVAQLSNFVYTVSLDLTPDWRVLAVTAALACATATVFGMVPALRAARAEPIDALKQPRGLLRGSARFAGLLVVAQVALSLVLVVGAGLFVRSFVALAYRDLGFDRSRVLLAVVNAARSSTPADGRDTLYEHIREAVSRVPGVEAAGISMATPLGNAGVRFTPDISVPGARPPSTPTRILTNPVSPGWFRTYGTKLLAGRDFDERDTAAGAGVVVANEAFARKYFGGDNPIGRTLVEANDAEPRRTLTVVGLVENAAFASVRDAIEPTLYRPFAQLEARWIKSFPVLSVSVRAPTGVEPASLSRGVTAAILGIDGNLSVSTLPVRAQLDYLYIRERLLAMLSAFFGVLALVIAGVGLYGVTAHALRQRRTEIGIRVALGATPSRVVRLMLSGTMKLAATGLGAGALLSWAVFRLGASLLYGITPQDPLALEAAVAALGLVAAVASWLPARRAASIDPIVALRCE